VRIDLGGSCFHLLFAVGLVAACPSTVHVFLLLAILVINQNMSRQLIPFVRIDGYCLLSDLTGFSDFFTLIGSFICNATALSMSEARNAAHLKFWAEKVFVTYRRGRAAPEAIYDASLITDEMPQRIESAGPPGFKSVREQDRVEARSGARRALCRLA